MFNANGKHRKTGKPQVFTCKCGFFKLRDSTSSLSEDGKPLSMAEVAASKKAREHAGLKAKKGKRKNRGRERSSLGEARRRPDDPIKIRRDQNLKIATNIYGKPSSNACEAEWKKRPVQTECTLCLEMEEAAVSGRAGSPEQQAQLYVKQKAAKAFSAETGPWRGVGMTATSGKLHIEYIKVSVCTSKAGSAAVKSVRGSVTSKNTLLGSPLFARSTSHSDATSAPFPLIGDASAAGRSHARRKAKELGQKASARRAAEEAKEAIKTRIAGDKEMLHKRKFKHAQKQVLDATWNKLVQNKTEIGSLMYHTSNAVKAYRKRIGLVTSYPNPRCVVKKVILQTRIVTGKTGKTQAVMTASLFEEESQEEEESAEALGESVNGNSEAKKKYEGEPRELAAKSIAKKAGSTFAIELERLRGNLIAEDFANEANILGAMVV